MARVTVLNQLVTGDRGPPYIYEGRGAIYLQHGELVENVTAEPGAGEMSGGGSVASSDKLYLSGGRDISHSFSYSG